MPILKLEFRLSVSQDRTFNFGYATVVKERRGNKDKKVLVINEVEARQVRHIFDHYLGREGAPKGLNEQSLFRAPRRIAPLTDVCESRR